MCIYFSTCMSFTYSYVSVLLIVILFLKKLLQALACFCHMCNSIGPRLHSCLHCIFFGCYGGGHIQEHAKVKKHFLGMEK